jgi:hypothetical protein
LPTRRPGQASPVQAAAAETVAVAPEAASSPPPRSRPVQPPSVEPTRRPATSPAASVFDDVKPAPSLPSAPTAFPSVEATAPVIPPEAISGLPTLPAAVPAAPRVVEPIATSTATSDLNAVRSAQLRAKRDDRRGKVFGHTFLALVVLATVIGGALVFGRSFLFPTQWDAGLTATVESIQERRGAEFPETVPLRVAPDSEYAALALEAWFGTEWSARLPEWRALGIATGAAESPAVVAAVVEWRPAFYDPLTDEIVRAESATDEAVAPALELALEEAFERQAGATPPAVDAPAVGVLSVGSDRSRNARAIDRELLVGAAPDFTVQGVGAPLPLLLEMAVTDSLGDELAATADGSLVFGDPYPDEVLDATAVDAPRLLASPVPPGAQSTGDPVAWGPDNWAVVLGNRLPASDVDRLVSLVVADSYRPIERSATPCFVAQFQVAGEAAATELLAGLTRWTVGAPPEAVATAAPLTPDTIELIACDPGEGVELPLDRAVVDSALGRLAAAIAR